MGSDSKPAVMTFGMVDDFLVHVNRKEKCCWAFSKFMDMTVQLNFICQKVKKQSTSSNTKVPWNAMIYHGGTTSVITKHKAAKSQGIAILEYVE
jgi:hypothetical protein